MPKWQQIWNIQRVQHSNFSILPFNVITNHSCSKFCVFHSNWIKSNFNQTVWQNLRHRVEAPVEQSANLLGFLQPLWLLRPMSQMFHFQTDMLWTTQFLKKQKINKVNKKISSFFKYYFFFLYFVIFLWASHDRWSLQIFY